MRKGCVVMSGMVKTVSEVAQARARRVVWVGWLERCAVTDKWAIYIIMSIVFIDKLRGIEKTILSKNGECQCRKILFLVIMNLK
jgi:hypothetical protein